jgi:hypothetical protein
MRTLIFFICIAAVIVCVTSYRLGYRSGIKQSRLEEDERGLVVLTLGGYKAAQATNWTKVKSLLSVEILGFTRDYERRFGVPSGSNSFVARFTEAKAIANQVETQLVPVESSLQSALGSNFDIKVER